MTNGCTNVAGLGATACHCTGINCAGRRQRPLPALAQSISVWLVEQAGVQQQFEALGATEGVALRQDVNLRIGRRSRKFGERVMGDLRQHRQLAAFDRRPQGL